LTALYLFELGEECGQWTVNFEAGKGKITKGVEGEANCTVIVSAEDFLKILSKEANSQMMFMTGKLKVKGNMGLAMKLQKILG
jgi:putative sterol carrier protein